MKVLVLISLVGGLMLSSCGGSSSKNNANVKEVNPADTIYLGDLREKFANDSVFFKIYGHENEMYKEPMNLKRGKGVYMRELRECGGRTEDKTKCAKG